MYQEKHSEQVWWRLGQANCCR